MPSIRAVGAVVALLLAAVPVAASASFTCTGCVFDPTVETEYPYDYTVPPDGRTYRWTISYTSADPDARLSLGDPNQTEVFDFTRGGDLSYDGNPPYRFDETVAPGLTTILVRAPRAFDFCADPGPDTQVCQRDVHIWGNGTFLTATGTAPIFATFSESLVPEPALWVQLVAGFGAAGAVLRRRRAPAT